MPFYRREKAFERRCITVSRADMSNRQEQIYKRLKPLDTLIMNHIKTGTTMNMDETQSVYSNTKIRKKMKNVGNHISGLELEDLKTKKL